MPEKAAGEYQATFNAGTAAAQMLAPVLMASLLIGLGRLGWYVLAAIFLVAAAPTVPAARWALRTRPGATG
jgi:hypothetical protein